ALPPHGACLVTNDTYSLFLVHLRVAWQREVIVRRSFTRRRALGAAAAVAGSGVAARLSQLSSPAAEAAAPAHHHHPLVPGSSHSGFAHGSTTVDPAVNGFDPSAIMRDFDWGKTRRLAGGRVLREWELVATDKEIEIVPGVKFSAW